MCIIVHDARSTKERLSRSILERCEETNPHGMGIMWATGKHLRVWKTLDDFEGIWDRYCNARSQSYPVAIHFRVSTHGLTSLDNCHPFVLEHDSLAFMHNGTISRVSRYLKDDFKEYSDTRYFAERILGAMNPDFLRYPAVRDMLDSYIHTDRLLFMDGTGNSFTFNTRQGFMHDGVWFSHDRTRRYIIDGIKPDPKPVKVYSNHTPIPRHVTPLRGESPRLGKAPRVTKPGPHGYTLLFDHLGILRYHSGFVAYYEKPALVRSHALYAVDTALSESISPILMPVPVARHPFDANSITRGKIALIRGRLLDILAEADVILDRDGLSLRRQYGAIPIESGNSSTTVTGYYYDLDPSDLDITSTLTTIPNGDWWTWEHPDKGFDPLMLPSPRTSRVTSFEEADTQTTFALANVTGRVERNIYHCVVCKQDRTTAFWQPDKSTPPVYSHMIWCETCSEVYPLFTASEGGCISC